MARRKVIGAGCLLAAAILVGLVVLLSRPQPPLPSWTLPDGTTLRFLQVTYGTNHVYNYGHRLVDLLYPLVPAAYRTNFHFQVARFASPPPGGPMLWMERTGKSTNSTIVSPGVVRSSYSTLFLTVSDETGVESNLIPLSRRLVTSNGASIYTATLLNYPRRSKSLTIRLHDSPSTTTGGFAEFKIPNPRPRQAPQWTAEPLPATRRTNALEIRLLQFQFPPLPRNSPSVAALSRHLSAQARLEILENGEPATNWSVTSVLVSNAVAEVHELNGTGSRPRAGMPYSVNATGPYWSEENAWKLLVRVARTADFPPEDIWQMRGVAFPVQVTGIAGLSWTTNQAAGEDILFNAFASPRLTISSSNSVSTLDFPNLGLRFLAPTNFFVTLIEVTDDQGRALTSRGGGSTTFGAGRGGGPVGRSRDFIYLAPADASSVDVVAGLSRIFTVEFTVKPATNAAAMPGGPSRDGVIIGN